MEVRIREARRGDRAVLGELAFAVGAGEALGVLGPSGIGKTTLLRLLAGLDPVEGEVTGAGRVAVVFQEPTLLPWRTARDNVMLAAGVGAADADAMLAEVGLGDRGDAFPRALSLGQARRVALARAFAVRPETLLLDEPFVSLDPEGALRMQALLKRLTGAHPVRTVLVTHRAEECARLCDRVLRLDGTPATIAADWRLPPRPRDAAGIACAVAMLEAPGARVACD